MPFGDQSFLEIFDEPPVVPFTPQSGQWSIVDGTYRNSAIQATTITLAPVRYGMLLGPDRLAQFTFRAHMLNPYSGPGNLVGIVFNYAGGGNYSEVVFSPTGVASVHLVEKGIAKTLATANYGGSRNVPFAVALENSHELRVGPRKRRAALRERARSEPQLVPEGGVGLITHWAPGRFDNVEFDRGVFRSCALAFNESAASDSVVSGAWNTNGGTLNSTAVGPSDIVNLKANVAATSPARTPAPTSLQRAAAQ